MSKKLKAFRVDDTDLYAAEDAAQADALYFETTGEHCEAPDYPREMTDEDLDKPLPESDENDNVIPGEMTSVREFLSAHGDEPGFLAGTHYSRQQ